MKKIWLVLTGLLAFAMVFLLWTPTLAKAEGPEISVSYTPESPTGTDAIVVRAEISNATDIGSVKIWYQVCEGDVCNMPHVEEMESKGGVYEKSIGPFGETATSVEFKVMLYDSQDNQIGVSDMVTLTLSSSNGDQVSGNGNVSGDGNGTGEKSNEGGFIPGFEAPIMALATVLGIMTAYEIRKKR